MMSSTRASPTTRLSCWQESSVPCTSSVRRRGDHPVAASSAVTPPTSSPTVASGRNSTPPTSMTTPTRMTTATATTRRITASEIRRSSKRSCPERVLPWVTSTSRVKTPLAQKRMRRSSASKATLPVCALWANLQGTLPTMTLM
jgi:hypothetical protein